MGWLAVIFEIEAASTERLGDALLEAGALAVDISDSAAGTPQEQPLFAEPGADPPRAWTRSRLTALFSSEAELSTLVPGALSSIGLHQTTPYRLERVDDRDWVRASQSQFAPIRISPRLWIVPSWHASPDPQAVNIMLDPGLAFGTGTHPTTRLCLRWLEAHVQGGETVVDFGCGSGILAIAALKLGAARATGIDIDEQALLAARRNAMQNRVEAQFVAAANASGKRADLVVANILATPLVVLAPLLAKLTLPGGRIALSGILTEQAEQVRATYRNWFSMDTMEHEEGWTMLDGVRKRGL
jgi:ribosomal protein L11 methyltransferase